MNEPMTVLQTLELTASTILAWKQDARISIVALNNYPQRFPVDGKELRWQFIAYSKKSNKLGYFELNKQILERSAGRKTNENWEKYIDLKQMEFKTFVDSDWVAKKALEEGLPLNTYGQIDATFGGIVHRVRNEEYSAEASQNPLLKMTWLDGQPPSEAEIADFIKRAKGLRKIWHLGYKKPNTLNEWWNLEIDTQSGEIVSHWRARV